MNPIYLQMIRSSVLGTLALGALVFIPAGTLNYWQGWAYIGTAISASALYTIIVLPPLDYRLGWSPVPWYVSVIGVALVALSFYFFYLVSKINTYAAANVRVEKVQSVVDTGVYGLVRHPMYFGTLFLIVDTPLALGSWWTLLLTPAFLLLLYFRIASEEKVLMRDLAGYAEYQRKVRYRLIPFIW
jgi:protein-S-isoprenylcysteine O-methyltransferase Ste14